MKRKDTSLYAQYLQHTLPSLKDSVSSLPSDTLIALAKKKVFKEATGREAFKEQKSKDKTMHKRSVSKLTETSFSVEMQQVTIGEEDDSADQPDTAALTKNSKERKRKNKLLKAYGKSQPN